MKKLFLVVAILAMAAIPSFGQYPVAAPYLIDYFSNNPGPGGAADQTVRLVNVGQYGTPLTSPVGDICANVYVFDANQEMVACCSCRITPNGLLTLSVANGLTNNPVTSVVPVNGAVKIIPTLAGATCSPLTYNGGVAPGLVGWASHIETSGGTAPGTFIAVAALLGWPEVPDTAGASEAAFLPTACQFAQYLGSNKGVCACK
jgi:hypothetical protein